MLPLQSLYSDSIGEYGLCFYSVVITNHKALPCLRLRSITLYFVYDVKSAPPSNITKYYYNSILWEHGALFFSV